MHIAYINKIAPGIYATPSPSLQELRKALIARKAADMMAAETQAASDSELSAPTLKKVP